MKKAVRPTLFAVLIPAVLISPQSLSSQETSRSDRYYAGVLATAFNHRSVGAQTKESAWGTGGTLIVGSHITDRFHTELRAGTGATDADVSGTDLSLGIDYFASWYMGLHYPVSESANLYGQVGFSYVQGSATLDNPSAPVNAQFHALAEEFPDSNFSISWLAGLDFEFMDNTYLVLEGGRLFKDTGTDINSFQFSGGLRYEF